MPKYDYVEKEVPSMPHMDVPWKVSKYGNVTNVITFEALPWVVCSMGKGLYGDNLGIETAQAICMMHNLSLQKEEEEEI